MSTPRRTTHASKRQPKRTQAEAIEHVKGLAGSSPRWTVHRADSPPLKDGDGHVVFIAETHGFGARAVARIFFSREGLAYSEVQEIDVRAFKPNCWTPARAVLVRRGERDLVEERYELGGTDV